MLCPQFLYPGMRLELLKSIGHQGNVDYTMNRPGPAANPEIQDRDQARFRPICQRAAGSYTVPGGSVSSLQNVRKLVFAYHRLSGRFPAPICRVWRGTLTFLIPAICIFVRPEYGMLKITRSRVGGLFIIGPFVIPVICILVRPEYEMLPIYQDAI